MATKRIKWVCPNGCPAVLGPQRPRRDNIVRYCLACSAKAGKLVPRSAPTMEKKAQTSAERSAAKSKARRERETARAVARWTVDGVDLTNALSKAMTLPTAKNLRRAPDFTITRSATKDYTTGRAWFSQNRIHLTVGVGENASRAVGVMLHELAHIVTHRRGENGRDASRQFDRRCADLHDEWNAKYGHIVEVNVKASGSYAGPRGRRRRDWSLQRTGAVVNRGNTFGITTDTYLDDSVWERLAAGLPDGVTMLVAPLLDGELTCRYVEPWGGDVEDDPGRAIFIQAYLAGESIRQGKVVRHRFRLEAGQLEHLRDALKWAVEDWDDVPGARQAAVRLVRQLTAQVQAGETALA